MDASSVTALPGTASASSTLIQKMDFFAFFDLPRELRDSIYGFYFSFPSNADITEAMDYVPSRNLPLASKAIKAETEKLYRRVYRLFWTQTAFTLRLVPGETSLENVLASIGALDGSGLDRVSRISVETTVTEQHRSLLTLDLTPAMNPYMLPWAIAPCPIQLTKGMSVVPSDTITFVTCIDEMRNEIDDERRHAEVKKAAVWAGLNDQCKSLRAKGKLRMPNVLTSSEDMELRHLKTQMKGLQPLTLDRVERKKADLKAIVRILLLGQVGQTGYGFVR